MTPSQIKNYRLALGMSPREFGEALGLGGKPANIRNEVQKWERDPVRSTAKAFPPNRELNLRDLLAERGLPSPTKCGK